jgi:hypothetical protein
MYLNDQSVTQSSAIVVFMFLNALTPAFRHRSPVDPDDLPAFVGYVSEFEILLI